MYPSFPKGADVARKQSSSRARLGVLAGAAAAALLAFPGIANAAVSSTVDGAGALTVTSSAGDAIAITCASGDVKINGADPGSGAAACADITSITVTGDDAANVINLAGATTADFTDVTAVTINGAGGNDTITGSQFADTISGGAGNDRIVGGRNPANTRDIMLGEAGDDTLVWNPGDGDDTMDGADGNDTIEVNGGGGGEQFTVKPSSTPGRVQFDRTGPTPPGPFNLDIGTSERLDMNANGGEDTVTAANGLNALGFALDIDGGDGNDVLTGGDGPDVITGGAGNDRIVGGRNPANTRDTMLGEAGDDTLVWNPGDGDDTMDGADGNDTIEANGGEDTVTAANGLNALGFALDIDGGDGNDVLTGGDGPDVITGGAGNDRIVGGRNPANTRDTMLGEAGDDTLVWNPGDGDDTMDGADGNDTIEVNGGGGGEQFTVKPSSTPGRVQFDRTGPTSPSPFNLDVGISERLDMNANGGDDTVTAANGLNALGFALDIDGGDGNDVLTGGDGNDVMSGGAGNDRIVGGRNPANTRDTMLGDAGDDTLVWNPGDGDDTMDGAAGNDTIEVNGGGGGEQFTVKPSSTPGRVQFDRTGPTPPGPFNLDIGTSENLVLNAGGGDDTITGSKGLAGLIKSTFNGDDGNDRITGTDGEDVLNGGMGDDIIHARDKAEDRIDCGSGFDLARVDKRDVVRGCNIVIGGGLKVKIRSKVLQVAGGALALKLRCVGTRRCEGRVTLVRGGKKLGTKNFDIKRQSKTVRLKLNRRGLRLASAKGAKVGVRIDAKDTDGNGWRSTTTRRLTR